MLNRDKVNQFFTDIRDILSDAPINQDNLIRQVTDKEGKQRTNVIYLTTACNLRCEYCYEKDSREGLPDQANLTFDKIDQFLEEIVSRESDQISTIVIMGGEPFLRFDLVQYIVARTIQIPKEKGWGISIVTNGTLFTSKRIKEFKHLMDLCYRSKKTHLSLEISYDGSGQEKRKWPDGSSSRPLVEKAIDTLSSEDIPFKISYVIHDLNYKNVLEDLITILERWPKVERLLIGYAYENLDSALGIPSAGQTLKNQLMPSLIEIYKEYNIPICGHVCGYCKICDRSRFVGNSYLSPTTGISYDKKNTEHKFQQF